MNRTEAKALSDRWHDLSTVCWCRDDGRLCSACREQDAIMERAKAAGWNIFNRGETMANDRENSDVQISMETERLKCIAELEIFARRYVAEHGHSEGAKAQGWAILLAAHALRPGHVAMAAKAIKAEHGEGALKHVKRYTGDELHGFMFSDYRNDEARWIDGKDYDALAKELAEMTAMRDGFKAACDLFLDDIAKLTAATP